MGSSGATIADDFDGGYFRECIGKVVWGQKSNQSWRRAEYLSILPNLAIDYETSLTSTLIICLSFEAADAILTILVLIDE